MVELSEYEKVSAPLGAIKQVLIGTSGDYGYPRAGGDVLYNDGEWVKSGQVYLKSDYPQLSTYLGFINAQKLGAAANSPGLIDRIVYGNNASYYSQGGSWGTTDGETFTANPTTGVFGDIVDPGYISTAPTYITHGLYENGVYLVGSNNNNKLHNSTDGGINWTEITVPASRSILNLKKSGGKYIAWLSDSRIWQSDDGANWSEAYVGVDTNVNGDAAYGSGFYVAGQTAGNIRYSSDFSTWAAVNMGNININGMEYDSDNSRFIGVGSYGRIYYGNESFGGPQYTGQIQLYTTPGSYSWTCPAGIEQIYVVCVGGGGGGQNYTSSAGGGAGGGLGWKIMSVTPGQSYNVQVGAAGLRSPSSSTVPAGDGGDSYFGSMATVAGLGGQGGRYSSAQSIGGSYVGDGGGQGGSIITYGSYASGGGGAGGYYGNGGNGSIYNVAGLDGNGGGGGGGGGSGSADTAGAGGGVGILGDLSGMVSGTGGAGSTGDAQPGTGGSGGYANPAAGGFDGSAAPGSSARPSTGGNFGGGGGATDGVLNENGNGGTGAVAILTAYVPNAAAGDPITSLDWKSGPFDPVANSQTQTYTGALGGAVGISVAGTTNIYSQTYPDPWFTSMPAGTGTIASAVKGQDFYVYAGTKVVYSTDNKSWTSASGFTRNVLAATYSSTDNLYLFGSYTDGVTNMYTTTDFVTVNSVSTTVQIGLNVNAVAYGNGVYVAGMNSGYLAISTDGGATFRAPITARPGTATIYSLAYGNGKFIGTTRLGSTASGPFITSSDGENWTTFSPNISGWIWSQYSYIYCIAYGNGVWVIGGAGSATGQYLHASKNGIDFISSSMLSGGGNTTATDQNEVSSAWSNIIYDSDNTQFIATGENNAVITSSDGIVWEHVAQHENKNFQIYTQRLKIINGLYIINSEGNYYTSTDSFKWKRVLFPKHVVKVFGKSNVEYGRETQPSWYQYTSMPSYNGEYYIIPTSGVAILTPDFKKFNLHSAEVWKPSNSITGRFILSQDSDQSIVQASDGNLYSLDTTSLESIYEKNAFTYNNGTLGIIPDGIDIENSVYLAYNISGQLSTSVDNSTWEERFININESLNRIRYGNGVYVARGNNTLLTSTDLSTWSSSGLGKANGLSIVNFNGDGYILDDLGNLYKYDPLNPLRPKHQCDVFGIVDAKATISVANNRMFALSHERATQIFTDDGVFWEKSPSNLNAIRSANTEPVMGIAYGNGTYIINGGEWISTNCVAWYKTPSNYQRAAYGNGIFVATRLVNSSTGWPDLLTSIDGETWVANAASGNSSYLLDIIFAASKFVAIGELGRVMVSSDGLIWDLYTTGGTEDNLKIKYLNNQYWISTGTDVLYSSSDGITWTAVTVKGQIRDIDYIDGKYYIVGDYGLTGYSVNGTSWTTSVCLPTLSSSDTLVYSTVDGIFVTSGMELSNYSIYTSVDGISWTKKTVPTTDPITKIIYENGLYVYITTASSQLVTSIDGNVWTLQTVVTTGSIIDITYGDGKYVYLTDASEYQYGYSLDGNTWLKDTLSDAYNNITYLPNEQKFLFSSPGKTSWSTNIGSYSYSPSYDVFTEFYVPKVTIQTSPESFDVSADKQYIAALTVGGVVVYEWDQVSGFGQRFKSEGLVLIATAGGGYGQLAVSPSGKTIFCISASRVQALEFGVNGFTGNSWSETAYLPQGISVSPDGTVVAFQEYALSNTLKAITFTEGVGFGNRYVDPPVASNAGAPQGTIWHPSGNFIVEAVGGASRINAIRFNKNSGFVGTWGGNTATFALGAATSGMAWNSDATSLHQVAKEVSGRTYAKINFTESNWSFTTYPGYASYYAMYGLARSPLGAIALAEDNRDFRVWPSTASLSIPAEQSFSPAITGKATATDVYAAEFSLNGSAVFAGWQSTIEAWSWFDADGFGLKYTSPSVGPGSTVFGLKSFSLTGQGSSSYISNPAYETYVKAAL